MKDFLGGFIDDTSKFIDNAWKEQWFWYLLGGLIIVFLWIQMT